MNEMSRSCLSHDSITAIFMTQCVFVQLYTIQKAIQFISEFSLSSSNIHISFLIHLYWMYGKARLLSWFDRVRLYYVPVRNSKRKTTCRCTVWLSFRKKNVCIFIASLPLFLHRILLPDNFKRLQTKQHRLQNIILCDGKQPAKPTWRVKSKKSVLRVNLVNTHDIWRDPNELIKWIFNGDRCVVHSRFYEWTAKEKRVKEGRMERGRVVRTIRGYCHFLADNRSTLGRFAIFELERWRATYKRNKNLHELDSPGNKGIIQHFPFRIRFILRKFAWTIREEDGSFILFSVPQNNTFIQHRSVFR